MDPRLFPSNEMFVAAFALSIAHVLINWSIQRAREAQWERTRRSFALRERYFIEVFASMRKMIVECERIRTMRDMRHAEWRQMARAANQDVAQSLIDTDTIREYAAAMDRLVEMDKELDEELQARSMKALLEEIKGDPFKPSASDDDFLDDNPSRMSTH
jgi:hypothetical protein